MENENLIPEESVEPAVETEESPEEIVEETVVETVEEPDQQPEAEIAEAPEVMQTEEEPHQPKQTGKIIVAVLLCLALLASLTVAVLAGSGLLFTNEETPETTLPETTVAETTAPMDLKSYSADIETVKAKAEDVVATAGDAVLTNGELQVYYWMGIYDFISANSQYLAYMNVDFTQPLDQQVYNAQTGETWQQAMLDYALQTWHQYTTVKLHGEENGYVLDEVGQEYMSNMDASIAEMLEEYDYKDLQEMLDTQMGAGATEQGYKNFMATGYYAIRYVTQMQEETVPNQEQLEQYYTDNETSLSASGITKESGDVVDVRHILILPQGGTEDENGTVTYSDEEWETCRQTAQALLDQWKAGEATEKSFGALAVEHSEDPGSKSNGGLYSAVTEGYMVPEFNDWIFDEARQYGDTDLVKTTYGYHLMYFVKRQPAWVYNCTVGYQSQKINELILSALDKWPMETNYDAIVLGQAKTE